MPLTPQKKSLRINEEMGLLEPKRDSYEYLHKDYATQKRFDSAYYYYQKYDEVNDSLEGIEKTKNINTLTFKYETEKKDQEIILLNKETELKSASFKIYLFVYGGILILLAGLVTFWYRVKKNKYENELNELRALKAEVDQENTKNITSFPVTVGKKIMLIDLDQITFFNAKDNYVFINTLKGKNFIIDYTLAALESHLPSQFVRVHRSYFINKNEIKAIKKTYKGKVIFTIKDSAASQIPSSIKYNNKVKDIIEQYGNLDS